MVAASMENRAPLRISLWFWYLLWLFTGCRGTDPVPEVLIPDVQVSQDAPGWVESQGILFLEGSPFSGWQFRIDERGDTLVMGGYVEGLKHGRHMIAYANGHLQEVRHFREGRQEGRVQQWHPNGQRSFEAYIIQDHYEGTVRSWYPNGEPYEQFHYQDGREEGRQQRWDEQGKVLANYEVRNGRRYGLSGTKNCSSPWEKDPLDLGDR